MVEIRMFGGKPALWCTAHCLFLPAGEHRCVICHTEKWERWQKKGSADKR